MSELNQDVRTLLENGFPQLWLEGEISNFACPTSGHWYFSLKDSRAQVRCAMFKNKNARVGFTPKQGDLVLAKVKISLYEARGEYQLIVESLEEAGFGVLQRAFEALKNKLQKEGLFDTAAKQSLPSLPKQIGVISSPTGAAIRDILSVLKRRFPSVPVLLYPVAVQGDAAAEQIVKALQIANQEKHCDVLLLARGGGSLEDLWSFNDERVARAIFHSKLPVVSGIGHEIDFTIADFVADFRAATPSAAAEQVVPDKNDIQTHLSRLKQQLLKNIYLQITRKKTQLNWLNQQIKHPEQQLREKIQRLDELIIRLHQTINHRMAYKKLALDQISKQLRQLTPATLLKKNQQKLSFTQHRLRQAIENQLTQKSNKFIIASRTLHTVSPLA
ncbi:MAG TPA: exodeoxyribonuclease VII large subunit, partial [Gammaproteobacteria bacterium]|nr:exodeoxyribonuclease VII large subunit [Gammaproteobacteria bacterium]